MEFLTGFLYMRSLFVQNLLINWDLFLSHTILDLNISGLHEMWLHYILFMNQSNFVGINPNLFSFDVS